MVNLLAEDRRMMKHVKKNYQTGEYNALVNKKRKEERAGTYCKMSLTREHKGVPNIIKPNNVKKRTVKFVQVKGEIL